MEHSGAMEQGDGLDPGPGPAPDPGPGLDPEAVEDAQFATVRRGYEPGPVRTRLREAADEIRRLNALIGSLSERMAQLEAAPPELEPGRVAEALGDEAARVLQSANDAARARIERVEAEQADILAKAQADASAIVAESRGQGREMVAEARRVRERILADLARRRSAHRVEMELLRTIHDRFMEALDVCREGLDGWLEDLAQTEAQAAAAADLARQRLKAEPEQTVAEIEAEIEAARLAGAPLDPGPGGEARAAVGQPEADEPEAGLSEMGQPEAAGQSEQAEPSGAAPSADPSADADAELDGLEDLDGLSESFEIVGYTEPAPAPSAPAAVRLYDVEADDGAADTAESTGNGARGGSSGAGAPEPEEAVPARETEASGTGFEAVFARLRSVTGRPAHEREESQPAPSVESDGESQSRTAQAPAEPPQPEPAAGPPAAELAGSREPSDPEDLFSAARAVALGGIARKLKRLVVDEQGDLLDSIRRNGARALQGAITADAGAYARAARAPMQDFASDIDVSIDDIDLEAAGGAIVAVLVEPVRARLGELLEDNGIQDPDELSSAVRSIYRESRSRRADTAAEAAFSAGWPDPVS